MPDLLVRDVDAKAVATLKRSAKRRGRSLQAELKEIIEEEARRRSVDFWKLAEELRARFADRQWSDSSELIREDRER